jgi:predicted SprT family Zn-dependent metalloprotease
MYGVASRPSAGMTDNTNPILAAVNAAGACFQRLVFTRNRRVLVSVGGRGRTLRLHAGFREAPPEVIHAVAAMYVRSEEAARKHARATVRDFIASRGFDLPDPVPHTRPRRTAPSDHEHAERLGIEFDRINAEHFGGELPRVPIALSGRMRRRNGHFSPHPLEIVISRRLFTDAAIGEAEQTLRHEMIHLWQHVSGGKPGHGADFRRWARRLDVHPRATRVVRRNASASG